jgi:hypothetical protein
MRIEPWQPITVDEELGQFHMMYGLDVYSFVASGVLPLADLPEVQAAPFLPWK